MNTALRSQLRYPDFDKLLFALKASNKLKTLNKSKSPVKPKTRLTADESKKVTVKKKKLETKARAKSKDQEELAAMISDIGKVVMAKDVETKDVKRRIVDLQAQSAVFNQDISMLLASIAMIESTSYTSLTSSLAAGVDMVVRQSESLAANIEKTLVDHATIQQRSLDLDLALKTETDRLANLQDREMQLAIDLEAIEHEIVKANSSTGESRLLELDSQVDLHKLKSASLVKSKDDRACEKQDLKETISNLHRRLATLNDDCKKADRLLVDDQVKAASLADDIKKGKRLVDEIKRQVADWSNKNKSAWKQTDGLIEEGDRLTQAVNDLKKDVEHLNKDLAHFAGLVSCKSRQVEQSQAETALKEEKVRKLKAYAADLLEMQQASIREVKVMRRTICS